MLLEYIILDRSNFGLRESVRSFTCSKKRAQCNNEQMIMKKAETSENHGIIIFREIEISFSLQQNKRFLQ